MPFGFQLRQAPVVGIDISSSTVKVVELSKHNRDYCLEAFARAKLPSGAVVEKEIKDVAQVATAVKKAMSLSRSRAKQAAVALADTAVMTKIIFVEKGLPEPEFEEHVLFEADKHIPYPIDEIRLDYHPLYRESHDPNLQAVFVAASRSETVDSYLKVLDQADLTPVLVEVESFAMRKACQLFTESFKTSKTIIVFDIGTSRTSVVVYHDSLPVFTRAELFGSEFLAKDISTDKLEFLEYHDKPDTLLYEAFKQTVTQHMKRAMQFYTSTTEAHPIEKIILSGSAAMLVDLDKVVKDELGLVIEIADPVSQLKIGSKVDPTKAKNASPAMMLAAGLALRSFD